MNSEAFLENKLVMNSAVAIFWNSDAGLLSDPYEKILPFAPVWPLSYNHSLALSLRTGDLPLNPGPLWLGLYSLFSLKTDFWTHNQVRGR
jgi:hypothetical protein